MRYGRTLRNAIRYGFPVGRVRVLEGRLLPNATLERLLDAEDFLAQKRVLADTEYGAFLGSAETAAEVEAMIDAYMEDLYHFLETSRLPDDVIRYFRTGIDHRNLKGRLKSEALGVSIDDLLADGGRYPAAVFSGPSELLPEPFRNLDAAVRDSSGAVDRLLVDPLVDRAMYEDMLDAARASGSPLLVRIAELDVGIANIRSVLRAKRLEWSVEQAAIGLVDDGIVTAERLMGLYRLPLSEMVERIASAAGLSGMRPEDLASVEHADVLADNLLMRLAREARLVATGVEPVIGYVFARRSEEVIVRTLLVGKIAGLSADALRGRVRELYV